MEQMPFDWLEVDKAEQPDDVALDPETTEKLLSLMVRAMTAVVLAAEEVRDER